MTTVVWIVIAVVVLAIIVAVALSLLRKRRAEREQRTAELRQQFGPEYGRTVTEHGSRDAGESVLLAREERVRKLDIHPLSDVERSRFSAAWTECQAQFVDAPAGAVGQADTLVTEVMQTRGYPVGDFDQQASNVSADHPEVVENYRVAHAIAQRQQDGQANTEDLRQAMVHYRALFDDLLQAPEAETADSSPRSRA